MTEMKAGYKQTDIGVIPEDWDEALIGDLFDFKNGLNKAKEFFGYGTPIVNYMDVFNFSGLRLNNVQGKVDVTFQEKQNFSVKKGDVFFTRTSETVEDIGVASVMLDDCNETVFSGFVLRGRPKSKSIEEDYCKYCFSSDEVRKQITSKSTYTTRALTNGRLLSSVILPLPKPEEQKQIAAALSDVDGLIKSLEQLITKKRDMKTAAMQQLLTGKKRLPGFDGEWKTPALEDLADFFKGKFLPKSAISDSGGISCIHYGELFTYYPEKMKHIRFKTNQPIGISFLSKANDVLMPTSDVTPNGLAKASCILQDRVILGGDILVIRPKKSLELNGIFLSYFIRFNKDEIMKRVSGTTVYHLYASDIKNLSIHLPNIEEQDAIVSILSDMDTEIDALEQRLAKALSLKTGMMQQLLTGKTRLIKTDKEQEAA